MPETEAKGPSHGDARAIVEGRHGDPFRVLGLHDIDGHRTLTVFAPGAERVTALSGKATETELSPVNGAPGLFCGRFGRAKSYLLRCSNSDGSWEQDDPYRFGPVLGEIDEYLLGEGTMRRIWQALGAHVIEHEGTHGVHFAVWAPNARRVSVVGDFNLWDGRRTPMRRRGATGESTGRVRSPTVHLPTTVRRPASTYRSSAHGDGLGQVRRNSPGSDQREASEPNPNSGALLSPP